jgi:hypothetical protein
MDSAGKQCSGAGRMLKKVHAGRAVSPAVAMFAGALAGDRQSVVDLAQAFRAAVK